MDNLLNVRQTSDYLGLSLNHVYKLVHQKKLRYYKPNNGKVYFKQEDLESYVNSGKVEPLNV